MGQAGGWTVRSRSSHVKRDLEGAGGEVQYDIMPCNTQHTIRVGEGRKRGREGVGFGFRFGFGVDNT